MKNNRLPSGKVGSMICLLVGVYLMYGILLQSNLLPFSIGSVLSLMNHWAKHWPILVIGLLPIYVALMLFGSAIGGLYVGSALQRWLIHLLYPK